MNDYKHYKAEDFLSDERFIQSIMSPSEETMAWWNSLIDNGELDIHEYTDAVLMLSGWKENQQAPTTAQLQDMWKRIESGLQTAGHNPGKWRPNRWFRPSAIAVGVAAAICGAILLLPHDHDKDSVHINVSPGYSLKTQAQSNGDVLIVTDKKEMHLEGSRPQISYDSDGTLRVDNSMPGSEAIRPRPTGESHEELCRIIVPYGKLAKVELSDGSLLWINAGTTVTYPKTFKGDSREISVEGEVFADVSSDGRPFIVHAKDLDVRVKGTMFDVSGYSNDDFTHVVLVEGGVEVDIEGDRIALAPNQAFIRTSDGSTVQTVNTDLYTSWIDGILEFENEPIENVLVKLARYYNITLILPKNPSGVICYGSLELKDEVETVLSGLMKVASFNFMIKDGSYYIQFK